ncbi:hypothetical protein F2P81_000699 [Scophthalmus maximus]|uniref:BZIP domain-containing protein n=1 Tax=Scophthalmus maximus TaxID=52904 RepID=A0A6A4THP3_SCOMX|nr:hypothetical protein F2P81_000699 [Scophthalmus maximus]
MSLKTEKVNGGLDFFDLLLRNTDETTGYHSNQHWTITVHDTTSPADDFLDTLLGGSDYSSAPTSPLWSPCSTTDSGINEDPLTDPTESLHPSCCTAFPAFDALTFPQPPPLGNQLPPHETTAEVSIDQTSDTGDLQEQFGIAYYLTTNQSSTLLSSQTLTVKDLLLSNLGQKAQQIPQHSLPEHFLNEDEKTLLAKEGVNVTSKLPLSKSPFSFFPISSHVFHLPDKFEERVLKKIRRKIRNKRSAQESRKKKRDYVDSLEGRMSACSSHNCELQRKIQLLEETNNALLEQLNQVQALLSSKKTHKGTCILSNSSASGPPTALSACGEQDEREISKLVSPTGAASNLAAVNLSLNCWLHILSEESSLDLHGDGANLAVSADDELCLVRFSDSDSGHWDPQVLLGLYQTQKVLLGFVVPLVVISVCYLLLLRFVLSRRVVGSVVSEGIAERSAARMKWPQQLQRLWSFQKSASTANKQRSIVKVLEDEQL